MGCWSEKWMECKMKREMQEKLSGRKDIKRKNNKKKQEQSAINNRSSRQDG